MAECLPLKLVGKVESPNNYSSTFDLCLSHLHWNTSSCVDVKKPGRKGNVLNMVDQKSGRNKVICQHWSWATLTLNTLSLGFCYVWKVYSFPAQLLLINFPLPCIKYIFHRTLYMGLKQFSRLWFITVLT